MIIDYFFYSGQKVKVQFPPDQIGLYSAFMREKALKENIDEYDLRPTAADVKQYMKTPVPDVLEMFFTVSIRDYELAEITGELKLLPYDPIDVINLHRIALAELKDGNYKTQEFLNLLDRIDDEAEMNGMMEDLNRDLKNKE